MTPKTVERTAPHLKVILLGVFPLPLRKRKSKCLLRAQGIKSMYKLHGVGRRQALLASGQKEDYSLNTSQYYI